VQKEILNSNSAFSVGEAFRLFDTQNKGFIEIQDMIDKLVELNINAEAEKIFERYDRDGDGKLSFSEFAEIVQPSDSKYSAYAPRRSHGSPNGSRGSYNNSPNKSFSPIKRDNVNEAEIRRSEWIDDLKEVLFIITRGEYLLMDMRNSLNVDGGYIFE
jgi:EF-hand domain pair